MKRLPAYNSELNTMSNVRSVVNAVIATLTLLAAVSAAYFTYRQASVAQDHERRALRAYVVAGIKLVESTEYKTLMVEVTAENMGQTPVYNLFFDLFTWVEPYSPDYPSKANMSTDCKVAWEREKKVGKTFARSHSVRQIIGNYPNTSRDALNSVIEEGNLLWVFGTVCYRDVFGEAHATRVCYWWNDLETDPNKCENYEEVYD